MHDWRITLLACLAMADVMCFQSMVLQLITSQCMITLNEVLGYLRYHYYRFRIKVEKGPFVCRM